MIDTLELKRCNPRVFRATGTKIGLATQDYVYKPGVILVSLCNLVRNFAALRTPQAKETNFGNFFCQIGPIGSILWDRYWCDWSTAVS